MNKLNLHCLFVDYLLTVQSQKLKQLEILLVVVLGDVNSLCDIFPHYRSSSDLNFYGADKQPPGKSFHLPGKSCGKQDNLSIRTGIFNNAHDLRLETCDCVKKIDERYLIKGRVKDRSWELKKRVER